MDALELLKLIPNNSVDLILTDPPYNTGMKKSNGKARLCHFFNDNLSKENYQNLVITSCNEFYRVLKENKAIYIYINWRNMGLWLTELEKAGFLMKNCIVWNKIIHGLNYQNYANTYELILFGVKGSFFPNNKPKFYKDVWDIKRKVNTENKETHHETEKLLKIVQLPILHASNKGDIVLDCFIGSGTTAVACKQLGRNFIGCDNKQEYIDLTNKRLSQQILKLEDNENGKNT